MVVGANKLPANEKNPEVIDLRDGSDGEDALPQMKKAGTLSKSVPGLTRGRPGPKPKHLKMGTAQLRATGGTKADPPLLKRKKLQLGSGSQKLGSGKLKAKAEVQKKGPGRPRKQEESRDREPGKSEKGESESESEGDPGKSEKGNERKTRDAGELKAGDVDQTRGDETVDAAAEKVPGLTGKSEKETQISKEKPEETSESLQKAEEEGSERTDSENKRKSASPSDSEGTDKDVKRFKGENGKSKGHSLQKSGVGEDGGRAGSGDLRQGMKRQNPSGKGLGLLSKLDPSAGKKGMTKGSTLKAAFEAVRAHREKAASSRAGKGTGSRAEKDGEKDNQEDPDAERLVGKKPFKKEHNEASLKVEGRRVADKLLRPRKAGGGSGQYRCNEPGCGRKFKSPHALNGHMRTHRGPRATQVGVDQGVSKRGAERLGECALQKRSEEDKEEWVGEYAVPTESESEEERGGKPEAGDSSEATESNDEMAMYKDRGKMIRAKILKQKEGATRLVIDKANDGGHLPSDAGKKGDCTGDSFKATEGQGGDRLGSTEGLSVGAAEAGGQIEPTERTKGSNRCTESGTQLVEGGAAGEGPGAEGTTESNRAKAGKSGLRLRLESEAEETNGKSEDSDGDQRKLEMEGEEGELKKGGRENKGAEAGESEEGGSPTALDEKQEGEEKGEEKMATRGLGKRERVPVRRIIEEDDDMPQRSKVDKQVTSKIKGGYKCEICGLIFGNGQALGGHKGSHKPTDAYTEDEKRTNTKKGTRAPFQKNSGPKSPPAKARPVEVPVPQGWACEICGLVFPTGQALGGHKGSHKSTYYYTNLDKGPSRPLTAPVRSARLLERSERRANEKTPSDSSEDGERRGRDRIRVKVGAQKGDSFLVRKGTMSMLHRPRDRLQSLAALVSKRSRRIVSSEEQERGKSSKMIAELLRRTAAKKADVPGGGALSPAGQKGKGMDSFEEDAVAGLIGLRQPIILAGEKGFSTERHRRKQARVKSSPMGSNIPERKIDDASTLEAAKVLIEGNGLLEEDSDYSPDEDEGAFSSGTEKSGREERRLLSSLRVRKRKGDRYGGEESEEEKPRRPETRTREERKLTRKLRDSSDDDDVWRPRIRDRTLEAARRAQAGETKKNWGEKKQRPKPRVGLLSELVTREGSLPPRAKEGTSGKEGGVNEVERTHRDNPDKSRGREEEGTADSLREGDTEEKFGGGEKERRGNDGFHNSTGPLAGGFRVPDNVEQVGAGSKGVFGVTPVVPPGADKFLFSPFSIPVMEEGADVDPLKELPDEEIELLPLSALKAGKKLGSTVGQKKKLNTAGGLMGNRAVGGLRLGDETREKKRRKKQEDAGPKRKKAKVEGGESRARSPSSEMKKKFTAWLSQPGNKHLELAPPALQNWIGLPSLGSDAKVRKIAKGPGPKAGTKGLKLGGEKPGVSLMEIETDEDAPIGLLSKLRSPEKKRPPVPGADILPRKDEEEEKKPRNHEEEPKKPRKRRRKGGDEMFLKLGGGVLALPANGGSNASDPGSLTDANSESESEDVPIGRRVGGYTEITQEKPNHVNLEEEIQRAVQESVAMIQHYTEAQENEAKRRKLKKAARKQRRLEALEGEERDQEEPAKETPQEEGKSKSRKAKRAAKSKASAADPSTPPTPGQELPFLGDILPPPGSLATQLDPLGRGETRIWRQASSSINEFLKDLGLDKLAEKAWPSKSRATSDALGPPPVRASYTVLTEGEESEPGTRFPPPEKLAPYLGLRPSVEPSPSREVERKDRLDLNMGLSLGGGSRGSSPNPAPFLQMLREGVARQVLTPPASGRTSPELGAFYRDKGVVKNGKWLPMHHPGEKDPAGGEARFATLERGGGPSVWGESRGRSDLPAIKAGLEKYLQGRKLEGPGLPTQGGAGDRRTPLPNLASERPPPERPLDLNLGVNPTVQKPPVSRPATFPPLVTPTWTNISEKELLSRSWDLPNWLSPNLGGRKDDLSLQGGREGPYAPPRFSPKDQTGVSGPSVFNGPQPDVWKQRFERALQTSDRVLHKLDRVKLLSGKGLLDSDRVTLNQDRGPLDLDRPMLKSARAFHLSDRVVHHSDRGTQNLDRPWPNLVGLRQDALKVEGGGGESLSGFLNKGPPSRRESPGFLELRSLSPRARDAPRIPRDGLLFSEKDLLERRAHTSLIDRGMMKEQARTPPHQLHDSTPDLLVKSAETLRRLLGKNENQTSPAIRSYAEGVKNMLLEGSKLLTGPERHKPSESDEGVTSRRRSLDGRLAGYGGQRPDSVGLAEPEKASDPKQGKATTSTLPGWLASEVEKRRKAEGQS